MPEARRQWPANARRAMHQAGYGYAVTGGLRDRGSGKMSYGLEHTVAGCSYAGFTCVCFAVFLGSVTTLGIDSTKRTGIRNGFLLKTLDTVKRRLDRAMQPNQRLDGGLLLCSASLISTALSHQYRTQPSIVIYTRFLISVPLADPESGRTV